MVEIPSHVFSASFSVITPSKLWYFDSQRPGPGRSSWCRATACSNCASYARVHQVSVLSGWHFLGAVRSPVTGFVRRRDEGL